MMRIWRNYFSVCWVAIMVTACASEEGRWYSEAQVLAGQKIYKQNCAVCHGDHAQGTPDWRKRDVNGNLVPPPLNGTAHAWHHPMSVLLRTIENGGIPLGGTMPAFAGKIGHSQRVDVIAYFQSYWNDEIYQAWIERGGLK